MINIGSKKNLSRLIVIADIDIIDLRLNSGLGHCHSRLVEWPCAVDDDVGTADGLDQAFMIVYIDSPERYLFAGAQLFLHSAGVDIDVP